MQTSYKYHPEGICRDERHGNPERPRRGSGGRWHPGGLLQHDELDHHEQGRNSIKFKKFKPDFWLENKPKLLVVIPDTRESTKYVVISVASTN